MSAIRFVRKRILENKGMRFNKIKKDYQMF